MNDEKGTERTGEDQETAAGEGADLIGNGHEIVIPCPQLTPN